MAEEIFCPVCETPNEAWNELCEACGAELHAHAGEEALEADSEPADFEDFEDFEGFEAAEETAGDPAEFADEPSDFGVEPANDDFELADDTGVDHDAPEADEPAGEWEPAEDEGHVETYEDSVVEDDEEVAYELEPIVDDEDDEQDEFFADEDSDDDDFGDEQGFGDEQSFGEDSEVDFGDDEFAADGGAPMDPAVAADLQPEDEVSFDDEFAADSEPDFDDEFAADSEPAFDDEFAADSEPAFDDEEISEVLAAESEAEEEEPPAPPELEEILNPERVEREPIAPLPEPGPYAEPAVLAVFKGGEQLGEVAIDFDCTVLGLDDSAPAIPSDDGPEELDLADMEAIEPVEDQADEVAYELEVIEEEDDSNDEVAFSDDFGHDQQLQTEAAEDEFDFDGQEAAGDAFDEDTPVSEMSEMSEVSEISEASEASVASEAYEEPEDVEEGPVVDLANSATRLPSQPATATSSARIKTTRST